MDIETLKGILDRPRQAHRPTKLVIVIQRPGSIGGTPCVELEGVHEGFDWDSGKLMFYPAKPLTALTPEQLEEIRESAKKGQSWHANEAYNALRQKYDSCRVDAERYRFATAISTDKDLWPALLPLVSAAGWEELRGPMTPESLAELHDNQLKIARTAGLWPLKTEGEAA